MFVDFNTLVVVREGVDSESLRSYAGPEIVVLPFLRSDGNGYRNDLVWVLDSVLCNIAV